MTNSKEQKFWKFCICIYCGFFGDVHLRYLGILSSPKTFLANASSRAKKVKNISRLIIKIFSSQLTLLMLANKL